MPQQVFCNQFQTPRIRTFNFISSLCYTMFLHRQYSSLDRYLTALSVLGGMYYLNLPGALVGPMLATLPTAVWEMYKLYLGWHRNGVQNHAYNMPDKEYQPNEYQVKTQNSDMSRSSLLSAHGTESEKMHKPRLASSRKKENKVIK